MKGVFLFWISSRSWRIIVSVYLLFLLFDALTGGLRLQDQASDARLYLRLMETFWTQKTLTQDVCPGYPALLWSIKAAFGSLAPLPVVQGLLFCLALLTFGRGLVALGATELQSGVIASGMFFTEIRNSTAAVLTDATGLSFAIAALGALMIVVGNPKKKRWWYFLAFAASAAYLIRPVYLFLLPTLPLIGLGLYLSMRNRLPTIREGVRLALITTCTVSLPLLTYCSLRYGMTGNFGLVSAGGINLIGISGQLLEPGMLSSLSEDVRPLAARILEERKRPDRRIPPYLKWKSPRMSTFGVNARLLSDQYNDMIWAIAVPLISEKGVDPSVFPQQGMDASAINLRLKKLSLEIIGQDPLVYLNWFRRALIVTLGMLFASRMIFYPLVACTLLFLFSSFFRRSPQLLDAILTMTPSDRRLIEITMLPAIVFFLMKVFLVISVEQPDIRYISAAFAPAAAAAMAFLYVTSFRYWKILTGVKH